MTEQHTWIENPIGYLVKGTVNARFDCPTCGQTRLEALPADTPFRKWTMGHKLELWDGVATCNEIVEKKRAEKQARDEAMVNAQRAAEEQERARIAAGGAPLPSQQERILAAIKAAEERVKK